MAYEIKINPLDLQPDVAIGVDLPMNPSIGGNPFKLNYTTLDQAVANAKNLLLTNQGERVMLPTFGCDIRASLFENITPELTLSLENKIRTSFATWLPYIFISDLTITSDIDNHKVYISLTIGLEGNQFDTRSILLEINTAA
jgi:phage baseplate assembly protein W